MTEQQERDTKDDSAYGKRLLIKIGIGVLVLFVGMVACMTHYSNDDSASSQCRSLAIDTLATGDAQFTEITGVDNSGTVNGYVGQYRGGEEERVLFWHCELQDGEPVITWTSPAAP